MNAFFSQHCSIIVLELPKKHNIYVTLFYSSLLLKVCVIASLLSSSNYLVYQVATKRAKGFVIMPACHQWKPQCRHIKCLWNTVWEHQRKTISQFMDHNIWRSLEWDCKITQHLETLRNPSMRPVVSYVCVQCVCVFIFLLIFWKKKLSVFCEDWIAAHRIPGIVGSDV